MKTHCFSALLLLIASVVVLSAPNSIGQGRQMGGIGITVFADPNFRGKSATYRNDVANLDGTGLNDKITSLRVGPSERWEICEHANYQGRCVVVSGSEPDLRRNSWSDIVSSLRRVNGGIVPPRPQPGRDLYIVIFDRPTYRGNPTNFEGPTPDLGSVGRRAQSVTIGRGVWQLCEGRNFTGRCVTLDRSTPDLQTYRLGNRVGSAQPVGAGTPGPAPGSDWYVVVFDQPNYRGNPINYTGEVPNLNGRIRSITIGKGQWELCEGRDFTGRCFRLERSSADLRAHVGSLRPLVRQPR